MKTLSIYACIICAITSFSMQAMQDFLTLEQKEVLKSHAQEIGNAVSRRKVNQFKWFPGYIIKRDCPLKPGDRISGAEKLNKIMQEHQLDLLFVPKKQLYTFTYQNEFEKYINLNIIICQKIEGTCSGTINYKQAQQLVSLINYSGYIDTHCNNIIHTPDSKIAIIDTEFSSFSPAYNKDGIAELLQTNNFTPEAHEHLMRIYEADAWSRKIDISLNMRYPINKIASWQYHKLIQGYDCFEKHLI